MKTALKELIEKLNVCKSITNEVSNYQGEKAIDAAIKLATDQIQLEKQQIIDAYMAGHSLCRCVTDNVDSIAECGD